MRFRFVIAVFVVLFAGLLQATFPPPKGLVNDFADMLSVTDEQSLESKLREYKQRTTNEFTVVIVNTLDGMSIEEYANKLFHEWGVGKNDKDNGLMFLWSPADRKVRIEVGYGLEGDLPDGRAGQIIRENILPSFKQQQWAAGIFGGVDAIISHLDSKAVRSREVPLERGSPSSEVSPWKSVALILSWAVGLAIAIVAVVAFVVVRTRPKVLSRQETTSSTPNEEPNRVRYRKVYSPSPAQVRSQAEIIEDEIRRGSSRPPSAWSNAIASPSSSRPSRSTRRTRDGSAASGSDHERHFSGSYDSGSSGGGSGGGFGGGDSGGGGASGDY